MFLLVLDFENQSNDNNNNNVIASKMQGKIKDWVLRDPAKW